ncbi:hypothetical protein [Rhodococcus rhodochrous]|uniref:hypothetical protein n=1 Tax=Rhodococcus rhodochrous TaxID=1829 RepID=UPI00128F8B35|nr:hypothetical protein [Rhodococcus rhodochrous]
MSSPAPASSSTATSSAAAAQPVCPDQIPIQDPVIAAAVNSVQVPNGRVTTVRVSKDSGHPGEQAIAIDLCILPQVTANQLRPIATQYAKAIKTSPVAGTTFAVYVANYAYGPDKKVVGEVKLKDGEFKSHLWNGKPSEKAENERWEVVGG